MDSAPPLAKTSIAAVDPQIPGCFLLVQFTRCPQQLLDALAASPLLKCYLVPSGMVFVGDEEYDIAMEALRSMVKPRKFFVIISPRHVHFIAEIVKPLGCKIKSTELILEPAPSSPSSSATPVKPAARSRSHRPSRRPPAARSQSSHSSSPSQEMAWVDMASAALAEFAEHVDPRHVPKHIAQGLLAEAAGVDAALEMKDAVCQKASGLLDDHETWFTRSLSMQNRHAIEGIPDCDDPVLRDRGVGYDAARDVFSAVSLAAKTVVQDRIQKCEGTLDHLERFIQTSEEEAPTNAAPRATPGPHPEPVDPMRHPNLYAFLRKLGRSASNSGLHPDVEELGHALLCRASHLPRCPPRWKSPASSSACRPHAVPETRPRTTWANQGCKDDVDYGGTEAMQVIPSEAPQSLTKDKDEEAKWKKKAQENGDWMQKAIASGWIPPGPMTFPDGACCICGNNRLTACNSAFFRGSWYCRSPCFDAALNDEPHPGPPQEAHATMTWAARSPTFRLRLRVLQNLCNQDVDVEERRKSMEWMHELSRFHAEKQKRDEKMAMMCKEQDAVDSEEDRMWKDKVNRFESEIARQNEKKIMRFNDAVAREEASMRQKAEEAAKTFQEDEKRRMWKVEPDAGKTARRAALASPPAVSDTDEDSTSPETQRRQGRRLSREDRQKRRELNDPRARKGCR
jgi:hypothetical protein